MRWADGLCFSSSCLRVLMAARVVNKQRKVFFKVALIWDIPIYPPLPRFSKDTAGVSHVQRIQRILIKHHFFFFSTVSWWVECPRYSDTYSIACYICIDIYTCTSIGASKKTEVFWTSQEDIPANNKQWRFICTTRLECKLSQPMAHGLSVLYKSALESLEPRFREI